MSINRKVKIDAIEIEKLSRMFHALSSPIRLKILLYLADGEHCACEFPGLVNASQPNTSRNLLVLRNAGLVKYRKEGQKMIYSLVCSDLVPLILQWMQIKISPVLTETSVLTKRLDLS